MPLDIWTPPATFPTGSLARATLNQQVPDNITAMANTLFEADVSASGKVHRHKNGTYANRPAAGNLGRLYYATDLGALYMDNGTGWGLMGVDSKVAEYFRDDFLLFPASLITSLPNGFSWDFTGTLTGFLDGNAALGNTAIVVGTGATINSRAVLRSRISSATAGHYKTARVPAFLSFLLASTNTTSVWALFGMWGVEPAIGTNPAEGIFFRHNAAASANWFAVTRTASVETATDTGIAASATMRLFEIEILSTSSVKFYVDGVLKATHTTNIPGSSIVVALRYDITNTAAADKRLVIDSIEYLVKR